jgi:hypothetical protein
VFSPEAEYVPALTVNAVPTATGVVGATVGAAEYTAPTPELSARKLMPSREIAPVSDGENVAVTSPEEYIVHVTAEPEAEPISVTVFAGRSAAGR